MPYLTHEPIHIYTDGSCHTQLKIGAWAAILLFNNEKVTLSGKSVDTTHNRMELIAVIEALNYISTSNKTYKQINVISDSQYVVGLIDRMEKLSSTKYTTKKGSSIQNTRLFKALIEHTQNMTIHFEKIKAHQRKTGSANYNIEVDKLSRKMVREAVATIT